MATVTRSVGDICLQARNAARSLAALDTDTKNAALHAIADSLIARSDEIVEANARDMDAGRAAGLDAALLDRLALAEERDHRRLFHSPPVCSRLVLRAI